MNSEHISTFPSVLQHGTDFMIICYLKYGCHVCLCVCFSDRKPAHLEAWRVFFLWGREWREKKGSGGWKAERRGLGRSAIFQQARHTTWSLITHKALCNSNHRLGCIIRLNKTWPSLSFAPLSLPCRYKTFAPGYGISIPLLINWTECACWFFFCKLLNLIRAKNSIKRGNQFLAVLLKVIIRTPTIQPTTV